MVKKIYYLLYNLIFNPLSSYYSLMKQGFNFKLNKSKIRKLKNLYKDKECLIVGPAPSLNIDELKAFQIKQDSVLFTFNSVLTIFEDFGIQPDYYSIIDPKVFDIFFKQAVETFNSKTTFLIPHNFKTFNSNTLLFNYSFISHLIEFLKIGALRKLLFSKKPYRVVFDGFTVLYFTLQLALFMGFSTINLMGIDLNYHKNGIYINDYKGNSPPNRIAEELMNEYFKLFLLKAKKRGLKILNQSSRSPLIIK